MPGVLGCMPIPLCLHWDPTSCQHGRRLSDTARLLLQGSSNFPASLETIRTVTTRSLDENRTIDQCRRKSTAVVFIPGTQHMEINNTSLGPCITPLNGIGSSRDFNIVAPISTYREVMLQRCCQPPQRNTAISGLQGS
ncbi:hypothetical protein EK21DRAFT_84259 [Setomelanomma holmii]|uniref:Uncharacterized protein n=1 Tax=Setomelanomma holmii TaxID=210430 RepID=A0A9P4HKU2_9PLEO|nr:hypothetical protein EK21DRAFT_84259 [Setomelanomma holmii]